MDEATEAVDEFEGKGSRNEEVAATHPRRNRDWPDLGNDVVQRGHGLALRSWVRPRRRSVPPIFGALGFLAGATFSGVLGAVEGRRRFDEMSVPRFALLGAIAGLLFWVTLALALSLGGEFLVLGPVVALAGAVSAAGTLALARKAEERELLDAAADLSDVGLSEDETRQLLGDGR